MGRPVRFAGNPGRTKEVIESLAGQHRPRPAKGKEETPGSELKAKGR
jgi:hypothetical protein